jgi:hypothetical protein
MRFHNQATFYAEQLQTTWLPEPLQKKALFLGHRLPAIVLGILTSLLTWIFLGSNFLGGNTSFFVFLQMGLLGGFLGGWLSKSAEERTHPTKKNATSRALLAHLRNSLVLGALFATSFLFSDSGSIYLFGDDRLRAGLLFGIGFGLSGWIMLWLLRSVAQSADVSSGKPACRRFFHASWLTNIHLRRGIVTTFVWGILFGLSYGLSALPREIPSLGLIFV